jgi:hypothetical protein
MATATLLNGLVTRSFVAHNDNGSVFLAARLTPNQTSHKTSLKMMTVV